MTPAAPVMLFDAKDGNGKTVPAAGKPARWEMSLCQSSHRKLLSKSQPFVEQSANMFSPPSRTGVTLLPGVSGGSLWQPPAFSPRTGYFYVLGANVPMTFTAIDFQDSKPAGLGWAATPAVS